MNISTIEKGHGLVSFLAAAPRLEGPLVALGTAPVLTDFVAGRLLELAELDSPEVLIQVLKRSDFVLRRNSEWQIEPSARTWLLEHQSTHEVLVTRAHELLLVLARSEPSPNHQVPSYLKKPAGHAYHVAYASSLVALEYYRRAAFSPEDGDTWFAARLAEEQQRAGVLPRDAIEPAFLQGRAAYRAGQIPTAVKFLTIVVERGGDQLEVGYALLMLGIIAYRVDEDLDRAVDLLQQSVTFGDRPGGAHHHVVALNTLGNVLRRRGDLEDAREALESARRLHSDYQLSNSLLPIILNTMGVVFRHLGAYEKALEVLSDALRICEEAGDAPQEAQLRNTIGGVLRDVGRHDEAADMLQRSFDIGRRYGNIRHLQIAATSLITLTLAWGKTLLEAGRLQEALDILRLCSPPVLRVADPKLARRLLKHEVAVLREIAADLMDRGDIAAARDALDRIGAALDQLLTDYRDGTSTPEGRDQGEHWSIAGSLLRLSETYQEATDLDRARSALEKVLALAENVNDRALVARSRKRLIGVLRWLAADHIDNDRLDDGLESLRRAMALQEALGGAEVFARQLRRQYISTLQRAAAADLEDGRVDVAIGRLMEAVSELRATTDTHGLAGTLADMGAAFHAVQDLGSAARALREAAALALSGRSLEQAAATLVRLARVYLEADAPLSAVETLERCRAIPGGHGWHREVAGRLLVEALLSVGKTHLSEGATETAVDVFERALAVQLTVDVDQEMRERVLRELARALDARIEELQDEVDLRDRRLEWRRGEVRAQLKSMARARRQESIHLEQAGNLLQAISIMRRNVELQRRIGDPTFLRLAQHQLARLMLARVRDLSAHGSFDEGLGGLVELSELAHNMADDRLVRIAQRERLAMFNAQVDIDVESGKIDSARERIASLFSSTTHAEGEAHPFLLLRLVLLHERRGDLDAALRDARRLVDLQQQAGDAWFVARAESLKAGLLVRVREFEEAGRAADEAIRLYEEHPGSRSASERTTCEAFAYVHLANAMGALDQIERAKGAADRAILLFERVQNRRGTVRARMVRARLAAIDAQLDDALAQCEEIRRAEGEMTYRRSEQFWRSQAKRLAQPDPERRLQAQFGFHVQSGKNLLIEVKDPASAILHFERARRCLERMPRAQVADNLALLLGKALFQAGRWAEAVEHLREVIDSGVTDVSAKRTLGRALHLLGAPRSEVESLLRTAVEEQDPPSEWGLAWLALVLAEADEGLVEAEALARAALHVRAQSGRAPSATLIAHVAQVLLATKQPETVVEAMGMLWDATDLAGGHEVEPWRVLRKGGAHVPGDPM